MIQIRFIKKCIRSSVHFDELEALKYCVLFGCRCHTI